MRSIICSILLTGALTVPALADRPFPPITSEVTKAECGRCHMAYQSQMLPARSWRLLLDNLTDHFGETVRIDEGARREILGYLTGTAANASRSHEGAKFLRGIPDSVTPLRITETPRFIRKHRPSKVPPEVWEHPSVGSRANCPACHKGSEEGDYDDDRVILPR